MNLSAPEGFFEVVQRVRFELRGPDAVRYLNGQLSIDISRLVPGQARSACLLTPKGKLCALVKVWRADHGFVVEGPAELGETIEARLGRYIIADDVELLPLPATAPVFHIFSQPPPPGSNLDIDRMGVPGFDTAEKPVGLREFSVHELDLLRIVQGVPLWERELTSDSLPQEARLEENAVDFDKGCYVGQETVSRLKSVGRVNKRLHGFLSAAEFPLGAPLFLHPPGDAATAAGEITSHARDFGVAQTAALGYLNRQFESLPRFEVADESGRVLGEVERREFPIL